jgi:hypothetical protein
MTCEEALATLLLTGSLDQEAAAHVSACAHCRAEQPVVSRALAAYEAPEPHPTLTAHVLQAAAPLLERNARRAARRELLRAIAAALLPLPAIAVFDFQVVRGLQHLLGAVLPDALTLYVVYNYAVLLAFLLALTYGAVPILAERQVRRRREESHA